MTKWYFSRGVWIGICTFVLGAIPIVQEVLVKGDLSPIAMLTAAAGIFKVYERVTSTGTPISS